MTRHRQGSIATSRMRQIVSLATERGDLTIGEILAIWGKAGFGFAMLLLALPILIPIPGPLGMVLGAALAILGLQLTTGAGKVWLPSYFRDRRLSTATIEMIHRYSAPLLARIEAHSKPGRLRGLHGRWAHLTIGLVVTTLAVTIILPIPFGNLLPVVTVAILAIGLIEKDGLMQVVGLGFALISLTFTGALLYGSAALLGAIFNWISL